jgi:type IV pilus assembly protein PilW
MKSARYRAVPHGLSLIELMVAVAIGVLVVLGVVEIFGGTRIAYNMQEGLSRVQENGRFALDFVRRDVRMAGHMGCVNDNSRLNSVPITLINHAGATPAFQLQFATSLEGFEYSGAMPANANPTVGAAGNWTPSLPAQLSALNPLRGSDILVVRYFGEQAVDLVTPYNNLVAQTVNSAPETTGFFQVGAWYGLADCFRASVFRANGIAAGAPTVITANNASGNAVAWTAFEQFGKGSVLHRMETVVYYVGTGAPPGNRPSLFRARLGIAAGNALVPEEVVEGVEYLQILYGQDDGVLPDGPDNYRTAAQIVAGLATPAQINAAWRRVMAVRTSLLLASPDESSSEVVSGGPFALLDAARDGANTVIPVTNADPPDDRRIRQQFDATIALRNRVRG